MPDDKKNDSDEGLGRKSHPDKGRDKGLNERKPIQPPPPAKKTNWLLRLVLIALLFFASTLALGYFAFHLIKEGNANAGHLKKQRSRASTCVKTLSSLQVAKRTCDDSLTLCQRRRSALDTKQKEIAKSMVGMLKNLNSTKRELEALRKQRAETAKRLAAFKDLTARFRKMIDSGKLKVILRNGRMVVKLPAGVLFASGAANLTRPGELALMEVAIVLRQLPGRRFMVAGHTDNRPLESSAKSGYKNNWELSTARAVTVTKFLIEAKMSPKNLVAAGYAQFDPVGDNKTVAGRQENRRIEIVLMPNINEMPVLPGE